MSRLAEMQARFQQRQMQEKEEKLLRLYENQQQRAFEKVSRSSSGGSSISGGTSPINLGASMGGGRVRQMFDERRQKAGIDRSYPLEPLKQTTRLNGHATANRVPSLDRSSKNPTSRQSMQTKSTVQRTISNSQTGRSPQTKTIKQSSNAKYTNGKLVEENSRYEEKFDNDYAINSLKQQQEQLDMMMNNHNIHDSLDDEQMPNLGIDELDEGREFSPSPNENDYYVGKKNVNNGNYTNHTPVPVKNNNIKPSPSTKRVVSKTPSVTKTPVKASATSENAKRSPKMAFQPTGARQIGPRPPLSASTRSAPSSAGRPGGPKNQGAANDNLIGCKFCERRFASDRIAKHEEICARTLKKKRKTYDAVKHRVQGTEVEQYAKKGPKGTSVKVTKPPQMPKTDWRRQHEDFIATIRAAKMAKAHVAAGGKLSDLPPPPPSYNPDYVQCPHCGRRFNEAAAERHIPKCATMLHNKPNRLSNPPPKRKF